MTILALFAAPALAQEAEEEEIVEEKIVEEEIFTEDIEELGEGDEEGAFEIPAGRLARGDVDAPALPVRIRDGGLIQVKVGDGWKDATLEEYATLLGSFAQDQDREMQKSGRSAYEMLPNGVRASGLFVSIAAEPTVPWQHIQWLMTIAAEQKYYKLELSDGTRKLLTFLPVDLGLRPLAAEPPLEVKAMVHAVARAEKPQKWNDTEVMRPTEIRYRFTDKETADLKVVADFMRKAKRAVDATENAQVVGEIKAGHKVPFSKVFDLMETFEGAQITHVNFLSTAIPTAQQRKAPRLPYPKHNYVLRD